MIKMHFVIGKITQLDEHNQETCSVFASDYLSKCIEEFKNKKYNKQDYFIDVWEQKDDDVPYPKADIKLDDWIFNV